MAKKEKDDVEKDILLSLDSGADSVVDVELTEIEKLELEAEAKAEVAKELKAEKKKQFKLAAKQRLKKQVLFQHGKDEEGEDTEPVLITLAPHTACLTIDGKRYYPGRVYRMGKNLAAVVKEQMFRGQLHENEVRGKNMNDFYAMRPQGLTLSPNTPIPGGLH